MANSRLSIIVDAQDNASGKLKGIGSEVSGLGEGVKGALGASGLGGVLSAFAGPAAIGAAVVGLGKVALGLESMREESAQVQARFVGFTGSAANANAAMQAFNDTLGNALTKDEKMGAAAQLMGLGLAKSAQEAATLTNQSLILGIDIGTLTQALETGRVTGLVKYGIAVSDVKVRAAELQRETAGLSSQEATAIAVKEQLAQKAAAVTAAGGLAVTSVKALTNQWEDLKDAAADNVQLEVVFKGATGLLALTTTALKINSSDADAKIEGTREKIRALQSDIERTGRGEGFLGVFGKLTGQQEEALSSLKLELAAYQTELAYLENLNKEWGDSGVAAALQAKLGVTSVKDEVAATSAELAASEKYWGAWASFAENAGIRASNAAWATRSAMGYAQTPYDDTDPATRSANRWSAYTDAARNQARGMGGGTADFDTVDNWLAAQKTANKGAGSSLQNELNKAYDKSVDLFKGYFDDAIGKSKGLLDLTKGGGAGGLEPGANGPFENIYRALDVAKLGDKSPWAAQLGLTQEDAKKISIDFQNGLFSEQVKALIDTPALVNMAQMQAQAGKLKEAFINEIAAQAGVGKGVVQTILEPSAGQKGASQLQVSDMAAGVVTQFSGADPQFATVGAEWMTQLAGGVRGQIGALTTAASEVVAAFLGTVKVAVASGVAGTAPTGAPTGTQGVPGLASGTSNWRGGLAMVGEQGPEMVVLPRGARVMDARQTERRAQNATQPVINEFNFYGPTDRAGVKLGVLEALRAKGIR